MSLNHEHGEITSYGTNFTRVETSKWAETNIFDTAYRIGLAIMNKKVRGIMRFDPTEVSIQEYHIPATPESPHLVFFFHKRIHGSDWYATVPVRFPDETLKELVMAGHWPAYEGPRFVLH